MKLLHKPTLLTFDAGLKKHWALALGEPSKVTLDPVHPLSAIREATGLVWLDLSAPNLPLWPALEWLEVLQTLQIKVIAASSNPNDDEGLMALDAGCAAYCHAYSDVLTLQRVHEAVLAGNVWVGRSLMNRLLKSTARVARKAAMESPEWSQTLTHRETEVANLAANGVSNQRIASQCQITERTVKAHLSAVFEKLNVTDRLQLALRVHGIQ